MSNNEKILKLSISNMQNPCQFEQDTDFVVNLSVASGYIQQRKLRFPAFKQHGVPFTLVVAESDVLLIDVAVACL